MCDEEYQRRIKISGHKVPVFQSFSARYRECMDQGGIPDLRGRTLNIRRCRTPMPPRVPEGDFSMNGISKRSRLQGSTHVPTSAPSLKGVR